MVCGRPRWLRLICSAFFLARDDSLALDVLANYVSLNPETQARNITAWTPVCTEILQGFCSFEDEPVRLQRALFPLSLSLSLWVISNPSFSLSDSPSLASPDSQFKTQLDKLYPLVTNTLVRELDPALRECVRQILIKVGRVALSIRDGDDDAEATGAPETTSTTTAAS